MLKDWKAEEVICWNTTGNFFKFLKPYLLFQCNLKKRFLPWLLTGHSISVLQAVLCLILSPCCNLSWELTAYCDRRIYISNIKLSIKIQYSVQVYPTGSRLNWTISDLTVLINLKVTTCDILLVTYKFHLHQPPILGKRSHPKVGSIVRSDTSWCTCGK